MECFSPKIGNKSRMSVLITLIQHIAGSSIYCKKVRKRNKGHIGQEGRNKIFVSTDIMIGYVENNLLINS